MERAVISVTHDFSLAEPKCVGTPWGGGAVVGMHVIWSWPNKQISSELGCFCGSGFLVCRNIAEIVTQERHLLWSDLSLLWCLFDRGGDTSSF